MLQFLVCYSLSPKCIQFIFHLKILQIIPPHPQENEDKKFTILANIRYYYDIYMYHHMCMYILHPVFTSFDMTFKIDHRSRQIWARVQNLGSCFQEYNASATRNPLFFFSFTEQCSLYREVVSLKSYHILLF